MPSFSVASGQLTIKENLIKKKPALDRFPIDQLKNTNNCFIQFHSISSHPKGRSRWQQMKEKIFSPKNKVKMTKIKKHISSPKEGQNHENWKNLLTQGRSRQQGQAVWRRGWPVWQAHCLDLIHKDKYCLNLI